MKTLNQNYSEPLALPKL